MFKIRESILIEYASDLYPKNLRNISNPPSRLYARGNVNLLNEIAIAVIGSRTNTPYGEKMCKKFVSELTEYSINIISGLALGIDSIAHKTCLKNSGKTIAVLPSGLNNIYPTAHQHLAHQIIENGGVLISEYEDNTKADSNKFLERNRIVAGLGMGTLVIEAGNRSGTSVTARYTHQNEKPVFCVPSSLENLKGKTTNELIQKGAKLVIKVEDILQYYSEMSFVKRKTEIKDVCIDIPLELIDVYNSIEDVPIDVNQIAIKTKLSISDISYKIMMLQLEDKIEELPGQRYIRKSE